MNRLERQDLMSLEDYAEQRPGFRRQVLEHKKHRKVALNDHASLYFEDRLTMQYQIQEMLRIEKIFAADAIQEELDAYNPLIPDGHNLKATFMLEYGDAEERQQVLSTLVGIEDTVWVRIDGHEKVYAIADEDLERDMADKTSAVHFMRFEFTPDMIAAARQGAGIGMGIDHTGMQSEVGTIPEAVRQALVADFD